MQKILNSDSEKTTILIKTFSSQNCKILNNFITRKKKNK